MVTISLHRGCQLLRTRFSPFPVVMLTTRPSPFGATKLNRLRKAPHRTGVKSKLGLIDRPKLGQRPQPQASCYSYILLTYDRFPHLSRDQNSEPWQVTLIDDGLSVLSVRVRACVCVTQSPFVTF